MKANIKSIGLLAGVLTTALCSAAFCQQEVPVVTQGDTLVVAGAVVPSGARQNPACRAGEKYLAADDDGDYAKIGRLFAESGSYSGPNSIPLQGPARITAYYKVLLKRTKPHLKISALVPAANDICYMQLTGTTNGYTSAKNAINQFTTNAAGEIVDLTIFFRPDVAKALESAAAPALAAVSGK